MGKNIAIVTFWDSQDNYGQVMQAYSLCRYISSLGHNPYIIKYRYREPRNLKYYLKRHYIFMMEVKSFLQNPSGYMRSKRIKRQHDGYCRGFDAFRANHIPMTDMVYDQVELKSNPPQADLYISGSDQIWSLLDPIYFLQFASDEKTCLAIGPSCGGRMFSEAEREILRRFLQRYQFIGLRENRDRELISGLGYQEAKTVVDPTLLLTADDYNRIAGSTQTKGNYILVYLISNKFDLEMNQIYDFAQGHHLEVKYVASQGRYDYYEKVYPTPEEWLGLVRDATHVVTNSFHGTVFSLLYNRSFTVIPQKGSSKRMNTRIVDLLRPLGLENRIFNGDMQVFDTIIDYDKVNSILNEFVNKSIKEINKYLE